MKRLYVFGAGASCAQGLPNMTSLAWDLCDFLTGNDRSIFKEAIFETFGMRRDHDASGPNFEEFLNRLDPRSFSYITDCGLDLSGSARMQAIEVALRGLRDFIRAKCTAVKDTKGPYDNIVSVFGPDEAIVSFNWDVLLELALQRAQRKYTYLPQANREDQITILKPHGSINWFALLDRELLYIDCANVDLIGGLQHYLLYFKDPLGPVDMGSSSHFAKVSISQVPAIVLPTSAKLLDVGGQTHDDFVDRGHREALYTIWKTFYSYVQEAQEIFVIGYSLPGADASSIEVLKVFRDQPDRRLYIIDKNTDVLSRYRDIVHPKAELVGQDFGMFDWTKV